MIETLCMQRRPEGFRRAMEEADFLTPGAPVATEDVIAHMSLFYDSIRERGPRTMTSEYSSAVARRYVDFKNPLAAYAKIPRPYVILQRINLGLFAILGEMNATADWRGYPRRSGRSPRPRRPRRWARRKRRGCVARR